MINLWLGLHSPCGISSLAINLQLASHVKFVHHMGPLPFLLQVINMQMDAVLPSAPDFGKRVELQGIPDVK